MEELVTVV